MIDTYRKPIFAAAGNSGPALGELSSPGVAATAFSVGAYTPGKPGRPISRNTDRDGNGGAVFGHRSTDNGGLKPDFLGVTGTLATAPGYEKGMRDTHITTLSLLVT